MAEEAEAEYETGDLESPDEDMRRFAIMKISRTADASRLPELLRLLETDTYDNCRHIARALGHIGGAEAERRLLDLLSSEEGLILGDTARALGALRIASARARLEVLLKHPIPWVKDSARWALKQIEDN